MSAARRVTAAAGLVGGGPREKVSRIFGRGEWAVLALPGLFLLLFSLTPLLLLVRISLARRQEGQLIAAGLDFSQYRELADPVFVRVTGFSLGLALAAASLTVALAYPCVYFIAQMRRRAQVAWLVYLLGSLSLSEVLVVFAFQILLSSSGTLAQTLRAIGLTPEARSLYPNVWAVLACLVYLSLPYVMLFLYPAVSKLDPEMNEAAASMGASPVRRFFQVTTPLMRGPLASALALVLIFSFSSYLTPLVLGRPQNWTVGVHLSNTAMEAGDMPLAAAEAIALILALIALLGLVRRIGGPAASR